MLTTHIMSNKKGVLYMKTIKGFLCLIGSSASVAIGYEVGKTLWDKWIYKQIEKHINY